MGEKLTAAVTVKLTVGQVTPRNLRPDVDWAYLRDAPLPQAMQEVAHG